jgi:hypothetical protein
MDACKNHLHMLAAWIHRQFALLADFLVSQALIMIVLSLFMGYRYFEIVTLFDRILPADVRAKSIASGLIAAVFIFSTIIFMVHAYRIGSAVKAGIFITALVVNLYFWQVWQGDWFIKTFMSITLASFDIGFAYLFHLLRLEHHAAVSLDDIRIQFKVESGAVDRKKQQVQDLTNQAKSLKKWIDKHTCPHCHQHFPSPKSINAHIPRCDKNPNKP